MARAHRTLTAAVALAAVGTLFAACSNDGAANTSTAGTAAPQPVGQPGLVLPAESTSVEDLLRAIDSHTMPIRVSNALEGEGFTIVFDGNGNASYDVNGRRTLFVDGEEYVSRADETGNFGPWVDRGPDTSGANLLSSLPGGRPGDGAARTLSSDGSNITVEVVRDDTLVTFILVLDQTRTLRELRYGPGSAGGNGDEPGLVIDYPSDVSPITAPVEYRPYSSIPFGNDPTGG